MPKHIPFNINYKVRVKVTDFGKMLHKERHCRLLDGWPDVDLLYQPIQEDGDGWSEWQLHVLMEAFGKYLIGFSGLPIEPGIEFIVEEEVIDAADTVPSRDRLEASTNSRPSGLEELFEGWL